MAKTLVYRRTEFVRDYYELEWTENDYQNLLDYLSKETDVNSKTRYEILKDLSFDDICKILNDEEDDIQYEVSCQPESGSPWSYHQYIGDYIGSILCEDSWANGVYDTQCDDVEEELEIFESKEE